MYKVVQETRLNFARKYLKEPAQFWKKKNMDIKMNLFQSDGRAKV